MTKREMFLAPLIGMALAVMLLAACGTPAPSPEVSQPTATSAPATAPPTQAPPPTEMLMTEPTDAPVELPFIDWAKSTRRTGGKRNSKNTTNVNRVTKKRILTGADAPRTVCETPICIPAEIAPKSNTSRAFRYTFSLPRTSETVTGMPHMPTGSAWEIPHGLA